MMVWYKGWWRTGNQKPPIVRKKERKARLQQEVYCRRLENWKNREPAKWRLIAHYRWRCEKPERPGKKRER